MYHGPNYDVARWQTHETEEDCTLIIRTNNGHVFYCEINPSSFHQSPEVKEQYLKCLDILRSGEDDEEEDFYVEDACDWISKPFKPLIEQLAPEPCSPGKRGLPTLAQYLYPLHSVCSLTATDENLHAILSANQNHGWGSSLVLMDDDFLNELGRWTRIYHPSEVDICYSNASDILIKPPRQVTVIGEDGGPVGCFHKRFETSFGPEHARREIRTLQKLALAQIPPPPTAFVSRLHGVVQDGKRLAGMLFTMIDNKGVLSKAMADKSSPDLRKRWAAQIRGTLEILHNQGIVWGDAKGDNILIDKDDNAWIIDFGGSYTQGWVDKDKAGTLEGDLEGLDKIMTILF